MARPQQTSPPSPRTAPNRSPAAAVLWTVLLLVALLTPGDNISELDDGFSLPLPDGADKVVHAGLFSFETFFLVRWLRSSRYERPLLTAILMATLLAVLTEVLQIWVPQRTGDPADLLADQLGIAICAGWLGWSAARNSKSETSSPLTSNTSLIDRETP